MFSYANDENSLGILLKECSKHDQTKAGKILAITGKSLTQASHQRIKLYMPLMRLYQEMDTFHSRAVEDTSKTVEKLETKRSQYRASLLWMKDLSEKLDPDVYRQLDKFRRVQNQVRTDKKDFDSFQMDVVQKIDLLMASRCNLINQILGSYQAILLETFEKSCNNFRSIEELIKKEDIYEYEFKTLKQLNPLKISPQQLDEVKPESDLLLKDDNNNANEQPDGFNNSDALIDVSLDDEITSDKKSSGCLVDDGADDEPRDVIDQLETLFGTPAQDHKLDDKSQPERDKRDKTSRTFKANQINLDLLNMDSEQQIASLLESSETGSLAVPSEVNDLNKLDTFLSWTDQSSSSNQTNPAPIKSISSQKDAMSSSNDFDLMGDVVSEGPQVENRRNTSANIDLLTTELEDIDNSSYFKTFQRLQL